jgi:hypothetical protein
VLELTLTQPPTQFGVTHWSSRLLATALAGEGMPISHATVARIWHRFGVQPWRAQTFKFSTDPALEAKIRDVAALEVATGKVTEVCTDRHRHQEFGAFLRQVAAAYPAASCTSWSTTCPPTSTPRCAPGSSIIPGSSCTLNRPRGPG